MGTVVNGFYNTETYYIHLTSAVLQGDPKKIDDLKLYRLSGNDVNSALRFAKNIIMLKNSQTVIEIPKLLGKQQTGTAEDR